MSKLALRLGLIAFLNLLAAFLIQWWTLVSIGPGGETDALYAGLAVPQVVLIVVMGSLTHVLVPLLAGQSEDKLSQDAWGFFVLIAGFFALAAALLFWLAPYWVPLLFPGFPANIHQLTVELTRTQLLGMFFSALSAVLLAAHHAKHSFVWPDLAQLAVTVLAVGVLIWALPRFGIRSAAWVYSIRAALHVLLLLSVLGPYRRPDWSDPVFQSAWRRIKPLIVGTTYYKSGPLVDRYLSSFVPVGGLSLLFFGQQLLDAVHGIVNKALTTPLMTRLSEAAKEKAWIRFRQLYLKQVVFVTAAMIVGVLVLLFAGKDLLRLLVGHGGVTDENLKLLWMLLIAMSGYLIGGGLAQPLSVAFYAMGETKTPTIVGVVGFTIGVFLKIGLFSLFGLPGIALGMSAHHIVNGLAFYFLVERKIRKTLYSSEK